MSQLDGVNIAFARTAAGAACSVLPMHALSMQHRKPIAFLPGTCMLLHSLEHLQCVDNMWALATLLFPSELHIPHLS